LEGLTVHQFSKEKLCCRAVAPLRTTKKCIRCASSTIRDTFLSKFSSLVVIQELES
jgi:hypothetical protein